MGVGERCNCVISRVIYGKMGFFFFFCNDKMSKIIKIVLAKPS